MTILSLAARRCIQDAPAPFVEILTCADSGDVAGGVLAGGLSGPDVLAVGEAAMVDAVLDRLSRLPTLPWMRGSLHLVYIDVFEREGFRPGVRNGEFDEAILLPSCRTAAAEATDLGYWTVLRLAQRLGMIAGRGVPRRIPAIDLRVV
ncbi:hypothetical protein ABMC89_13815 [Sulfitobacter sp. HNIBRBA3233]|uniref:hypothetical protein n=1 Tax=Sulfitobacter marinivivus TaxID=3158558 RepID=UPI0032DFE2E6